MGPWGEQDDLVAVLNFLDGWPLALVLAAPLLAGYSLAELRRRLEAEREQLLAEPGLPPEARDKLDSVDVSLSLSHSHLAKTDPEAAEVFALLALFPGGADEAAVRAVLGPAAVSLVARLRAASLVEAAGDSRVRLPGPARAYAERRLPADAWECYGPAAVAHYAQVIEKLGEIPLSHASGFSLAMALTELPNLHAFADWGLTQEGESAAQAARLVGSLHNLYMLLDWPEEGVDRLRRASAAARRAGDAGAEANTLQAIGDVQQFRKEIDDALDSYQQALQLFRAVGARLGEANTLKAIGDVQQFRDERDAALDSYQQALQLFRAVGARLGEANTLKAIGDVQQFRKEIDAALDSYQQALQLFRAVGDRLGEANTLKAIGDVQQFRKEIDAALDSYQQALQLFRAVGARLGEANTLKAIGDVQQFRDERDAALDSYQQALQLFRAVGDRLGEANTLQAIGDVQQFRDESTPPWTVLPTGPPTLPRRRRPPRRGQHPEGHRRRPAVPRRIGRRPGQPTNRPSNSSAPSAPASARPTP